MENNKEKITALELSSNSINKEVAQHLALKIKDLKKLQHANFSDIFVGRKLDLIPEAMRELSSSLIDKNIRIINLSSNAFGKIVVKSLDNFFINTKYLMELNIENCGLGPEGAELLAELLLENRNNLKLEVLIANRNKMEDRGAKALAK